MKKTIHEIRDPVHVFIHMDTQERKALDSTQLQRLRHIHQLGLTYLLYPGATHRRFEHSLGVMELATRIFDVITGAQDISDAARDVIPGSDQKVYWRRVLRMAALCHDIGHLPFSHSADSRVFPSGWNHERMTGELIRSDEMEALWNEIRPTLNSDDIIKIALGPKKSKQLGLGDFNDWEAILSEIIVGDTFGADRMDYLLRDSLHAGVAYGKFDHYRLVDTLRILPKGGEGNDSKEPTLGLLEGGLHSAEALLWARYFMYMQVYLHPVRRIYDIHLGDFLQKELEGGKVTTEVDKYLQMTDNEVLVKIREAASDPNIPGNISAKQIWERSHFKLIYERNPEDQEINLEAAKAVYDEACKKYGKNCVRYDTYRQEGGSQLFPVKLKDDRILQSIQLSDTLRKVPPVATDFVFIDEKYKDDGDTWLKENRKDIIASEKEKEESKDG